MVRLAGFEPATYCSGGRLSKAILLILRHAWQPKSTQKRGRNDQVVPSRGLVFGDAPRTWQRWLEIVQFRASGSRQGCAVLPTADSPGSSPGSRDSVNPAITERPHIPCPYLTTSRPTGSYLAVGKRSWLRCPHYLAPSTQPLVGRGKVGVFALYPSQGCCPWIYWR